ncbi:MAG: XylR family transcriptional regulator [Kiritimatiellales bacterium]
MQKPLKIAVLVKADNHYKYNFIRGVIQFAKRQKNWVLYGQNEALHNLSDLKKWKGDGIIAHLSSQKEADEILSVGLPVVDVCTAFKIQSDHLIQHTNNDVETGRRVAQHFIHEGFPEFAFIGARQRHWSVNRKKGIVEALSKVNRDVRIFDRPLTYWERSSPPIDLIRWLSRLPPVPVAVMTADDTIGAKVTNACNLAKINIPSDISIISVGNTEVICELCVPPLSSIPLDCIQIGQQAAASLHAMITGTLDEMPAEPLMTDPLPIVHRSSSSYEQIENKAVQAAINLIHKNKGKALSVEDVVKHCKVNRRTLEINFRKTFGQSIYEEIQLQKIQRACLLLQRSDFSISELAFDCGFNSYQRFYLSFKAHMNMTPKQYRKKYRLAAHIVQEY